MKKLAISFLNLQKNIPRYRFSSSGSSKPDQANKPSQPDQKASQPKTKSEQKPRQQQKTTTRTEQDRFRQTDEDEQPKYQKEDRSTLGWTIYRILFWGSTAILGYNIYLVSQHNKSTPVQAEPTAVPGFITAAKVIYKNFNEATQFLTKPPLQKLLPDIVHPQIQPKTLVLNVSKTLLDTQYVFGKGLIVNKRPGLNNFLKKMSQIYEVVIFSDDDSMLLNTLIPSMDPRRQIITGYFGHQCMVYSGGHFIKDLKYLNRDIKKIIVIDKSKNLVPKNKENVIALSEYKGDENDRQLISLTALLQNLASPQVRDVRKALQQLGDDPVKSYEAKIKEVQEKIKKNKSGRLFGFFQKK